MAVRNRRSIRRVEVLVNNTDVGFMNIESERHSPHEHIGFTYLDSWLAHDASFEVSPELPLIRGEQRPTMGREIFGSFADAAPDAWGQRLLHEKARLRASETGIPIPHNTEVSRLLMVNDQTRQGALRFRENGEFLSSWGETADLRDVAELAIEAQAYEDTGVIDEKGRLLIGAGSSPGGAQPKAWIRDEDGTMLLAKFPKSSDRGNVQLWEMVAIQLQQRAGIQVQPSRLMRLNAHSQIFLTKRFDRVGESRIPYISARTALQLNTYDHPNYVNLSREIARISAAPRLDSHEMFSRAAFGAMVNNIDDHMRNHGLLRQSNGWRLSPSFDVNPMSSGVSETPLVPGGDVYDRNVLELLDHLDSFRLTRGEAVQRLRIINEAISHWAVDALKFGAEVDERDSMKAAFEGRNIERVANLRDEQTPVVIDLAKHDRTPPDNSLAMEERKWIDPHFRGEKRIPGHFRSKPNRS